MRVNGGAGQSANRFLTTFAKCENGEDTEDDFTLLKWGNRNQTLIGIVNRIKDWCLIKLISVVAGN